MFFFFFKNEAFVYSDEEIEWYLPHLKGRILISNEPHGANDQFKKSKPTLWVLLQSLPTSFDLKEAFFGDMLWGEATNCVTLIYMQIYDAMLSFYVQEKCWIFTSLSSLIYVWTISSIQT